MYICICYISVPHLPTPTVPPQGNIYTWNILYYVHFTYPCILSYLFVFIYIFVFNCFHEPTHTIIFIYTRMYEYMTVPCTHIIGYTNTSLYDRCIRSYMHTSTYVFLRVLQGVAVCCSVLQCVAVCCSALQCDAVCRSNCVSCIHICV